MNDEYLLEMEQNTQKIMYQIRVLLASTHALYSICYFYADRDYLAWISTICCCFFLCSKPFIAQKRFALCFWIMMIHVSLYSIFMVWCLGDFPEYSLSCIAVVPTGCLYYYFKKNITTGHTRIKALLCIILFILVGTFFLDKLIALLHSPLLPPMEAEINHIIRSIHYLVLIIGNIKGCVVIIQVANRNASNLNHMLEETSYIAKHDNLTGLLNRTSLQDFIKQLQSNHLDYAFILGDIDDFKKINDTYGHSCGDYVLVEIANEIKHSIRSADKAYRWGGEEFVIILSDISQDAAIQKINSFLQILSQKPFSFENQQFSVTMTFGICMAKEKSLEEILTDADMKLYQGKQQGKNCVIY